QALARQALVPQVQVRRVLVHQVQVRQVLVECGGDAGGEDEALQQGVGRQPVGSVDAGAGDLAAGVEAGDGRPAVQVGADAAARVVGGRDDRDRFGHGVDAVVPAGGQDGGEAVLPHLGAEVAAVEEHVGRAGLPHPVHDPFRDDVAGGELGEGVAPGHEPPAGVVDEVGALAPHGLGDQRLLPPGAFAEPQHGRVELDELQVGDLGSGAQGERYAVAGRDLRVRRRGVDLAEPAGGGHDGAGADGADAAGLPLPHDVEGDPGGASGGVLQQVEDEGVLDDLDTGVLERGEEGAADLRAGRVPAGVRDAA